MDSELYLIDLMSKFEKINFDNYYLSYSGGRDSHFLYWFIKEYLQDTKIEVVGINTGLEFSEIKTRMLNNCDTILRSSLSYMSIKEQYGIPCFSKENDQYIYGYQKAVREGGEIPLTYRRKCLYENNENDPYVIPRKANKALLDGTLHMISHKYCYFSKKKPARDFEKKSGKLPIMRIMANESNMRKSRIHSCFNTKKFFYPVWGMDDEAEYEIEEKFGIEVPEIYGRRKQTGCISCPYSIYMGEY